MKDYIGKIEIVGCPVLNDNGSCESHIRVVGESKSKQLPKIALFQKF